MECDGQAIENDEEGSPVDKVRKNEGQDTISVEAPAPGSENAQRRPTEFQPKEVADGEGKGEPRNESEKIEGDLRGDDLPGSSDSKEGCLEEVKKIHEESVAGEKKKIPTQAAESG